MAVSLTAFAALDGRARGDRRRVWFANPRRPARARRAARRRRADPPRARRVCGVPRGSGARGLRAVDRHTRNAYLIAATIAAVAQVSGVLLYQTAPAGVVLALLPWASRSSSPSCRLHLAPQVADKDPAPVIGSSRGIDIVAFAELVQVRQAAPWLFTPRWPWMILGCCSRGGGRWVLALEKQARQADARAFDGGWRRFRGDGGDPGRPRWRGGAVHGRRSVESLGVALLLRRWTSVESHGILGLGESAGVARHRPLAAAGFVLGNVHGASGCRSPRVLGTLAASTRRRSQPNRPTWRYC